MYGRAARFRRAWYGRHPDRVRRLARPVVSVGNLVVGGSGKTPVVAAIARLLLAAGERPAILSRGYGRRRRADGVVVVSDGHAPAGAGGAVWRRAADARASARRRAGPGVAGSLSRRLPGRTPVRLHRAPPGRRVSASAAGARRQPAGDVERRSGRIACCRPDGCASRSDAARAADALLVTGDEHDAAVDGSESRRHAGVSRAGAPGRAAVSSLDERCAADSDVVWSLSPGLRARRDSSTRCAPTAGMWRARWCFAITTGSRTGTSRRSSAPRPTQRADLIVTTEKDAARLDAEDVADSPVPGRRCRFRSRSNRRRSCLDQERLAAREWGRRSFSRTPDSVDGCPRKMTPDPITVLRYRLEWLVVRGVRDGRPRRADVGGAHARPRPRAGGVPRRRSRRRIALENLAFAFPGRPLEERRALTKAMFAHFGARAARADQVRHLLARTDARGRRHRRGGSLPPGTTRRDAACCSSPGHFGYWEMQAMAHALRAEPISVLARPLDNPYLHSMLEDIRTSTGNSVIYRQGAVRRMLRELAAGRGIAVLIDQHLHTDAIYVGFFRRPAATTSALAALALAHRRAGDSGVCAAAAARPLPLHLRASRRSAAGRHARRRPRVHAALHRRARDVRAPPSRPVDVDASSLARSRHAGRRVGAGCLV